MRDRGAAQSLILKRSLSRGSNSATGEFIVIHGMSSEFLSITFHRFHLLSDLVSGLIVVGVVPRLAMKRISMLSGNELAGGKVTIHPKVVLEPITSINTKKIEEDKPCIFPSCVVLKVKGKARKVGKEILWSERRDDYRSVRNF